MTHTVPLTTRNATLEDLATLLREQHARKVDVVAPAGAIRAVGGRLIIVGTEPVLSDEGVTVTDGEYIPTDIADVGIADKLGIPGAYLKRLRADRADLYDANVNGWLHGGDTPDPRSFLVRCFKGDGDGPGIARAFLSDRYSIVDNLDVLMAALDGVRRAGVQVDIDGCDLTEKRMYVRLVAPQVAALAPALLAGYRSPFDGGPGAPQRAGGEPWQLQAANGGWTVPEALRAAAREGMGYAPGTEPVVFAGFVISNSETGGGAFTLTPRLVVQVCKNGLTITADALRAIHLGARLEEGRIAWSQDTNRAALQLVAEKTRDAVRAFLEADYVAAKVAQLEAQAGTPVQDAAAVVATVGKKLQYSEAEQATILDHFIRGGQLTAGGVMQAITSAAQTLDDPDAAHALEASAVQALALAAKAG